MLFRNNNNTICRINISLALLLKVKNQTSKTLNNQGDNIFSL